MPARNRPLGTPETHARTVERVARQLRERTSITPLAAYQASIWSHHEAHDVDFRDGIIHRPDLHGGSRRPSPGRCPPRNQR